MRRAWLRRVRRWPCSRVSGRYGNIRASKSSRAVWAGQLCRWPCQLVTILLGRSQGLCVQLFVELRDPCRQRQRAPVRAYDRIAWGPTEY